MKRPLFVICLVVVIAAVIAAAETILERTLDRQLPPLLTEELGLPVSLAPIQADIISLTARSGLLRMGDPADLAVEAREVAVSLAWRDLLRGEIRLVTGSAEDLMVKIAAWPEDDEPSASDYRMLEPWLPASLTVEQARFLAEDNTAWPVHAMDWQRADDGAASLQWREDRPAGSFGAEIAVGSLDDLLDLRLLQADLSLAPGDKSLPDTRLAIRIEPGDGDVAYQLRAVGNLAGMDGTLSAEGATAWNWPDTSTTHFDALQLGTLARLVALFTTGDGEGDLEETLAQALPRLSLPVHQGSISLGELRVGDEMTRDNVIRFNSSGNYLALTEVIMVGPAGRTRGSAAVADVGDAWEIAVAANITARKEDKGALARFIDSHWYLREGRTRLHSRGTTWGALVDNMTGVINLSGSHKGESETPVSFTATLDKGPYRFKVDDIRLSLGDSLVTGGVEFSGGKDRTLDFKLAGDRVDLGFLLTEEHQSSQPGVALPDALLLFPEIDVNWQVIVSELRIPGVTLQNIKLDIDRGPEQGHFELSGGGDGNLGVTLDYVVPAGEPTSVVMEVDLDGIDIGKIFGRVTTVLQSRTTGKLVFRSEGRDIEQVFTAMQGDADLKVAFRRDGDWDREDRPEELLALRGVASLVLENRRILGLKIEGLDIDTSEQDLDGSLSLVAGRTPYLIAELKSEHLNIVQLQDWLLRMQEPDEVTVVTGEPDILTTLRDFTEVRLTLKVDELEWLDFPVTDATFELESGPDLFDLKQVDFAYRGMKVRSSAGLSWRADKAMLNSSGEVSALDVNELIESRVEAVDIPEVKPLSGSFTLVGQGRDLVQLLGTLNGHIKLTSTAGTGDAIDIQLTRVENGMRADIDSFSWAGSSLKGSVDYRLSNPPDIEVTLAGGTVDLRPWEAAYFDEAPKADPGEKDDPGAVQRTGRFALEFLSYPARVIRGESKTSPGERVFSSEPWDLSAMSALNLHVHGTLEALRSVVAEAADIAIDLRMKDGTLSGEAESGVLNGGTARLSANFDSTAQPPDASMELRFVDLYPDPARSSYPRSGHLNFRSRGASAAELASHLDGMAYLELGTGPIAYTSVAFLTADAATSMMRALIPSAATRQPEMRCGITLADFKDGKGITPYGYAARTRTANLMGSAEVDLGAEQIKVRFRSQSREGAGISIGNAFSNSVSIAGPLSDPAIVPNAPALLIRGWAAFLTAGLSIIGESVVNRVLASGNPCEDIREEIRKDLCKSQAPLASSPIACPVNANIAVQAGAGGNNAAGDPPPGTASPPAASGVSPPPGAPPDNRTIESSRP